MTVKFIKGLSNSIERSSVANKASARNIQSLAQSSGTAQAAVAQSDAAISTVKTRGSDSEKVRDYDKAKSLAKSVADQVRELDKDEAELIHDPSAVSLKDSFVP